jgi:hypothetical protein
LERPRTQTDWLTNLRRDDLRKPLNAAAENSDFNPEKVFAATGINDPMLRL